LENQNHNTMNQKNIFTAIAAVLVLQGVAFFLIGDQMITGTYPDVAEPGHTALLQLLQVPSALSILLGLIAYANRTAPNVTWAFTIGTGILLGVTMKHMFIDHVNVPMAAAIIQAFIFLACGYLWSQEKKVRS
jgi:O-antigen/teichoic acid export membrane protein